MYDMVYIDSQVYDSIVKRIYRDAAVLPNIKNVIFNIPATIVFWEDGTKTVVKAVGERFSYEKGLIMAITKKALGNKGNYYDVIKKWVGEDKLFPENNKKKSKKNKK